MNTQTHRNIRGLTLIEILIAIGIFALLATLIVGVLSNYRDEEVLAGEYAQTLSVFHKARSYTLSSKNELAYGVRINADRLILYPGPAFASSTPENEEYLLHNAVSVSEISLMGGGNDIFFKRLSGETEDYGTITISLRADPLRSRVITVGQSGYIGGE